MHEQFQPTLKQCEPYVLATPLVEPGLNLHPLGLSIPPHLRLNPQHRRNSTFLNMIKRLDELTFGPVGMPMPKWVFYDCAVMPGAVFGLCSPAAAMESWVKQSLGVPDDYEGPVPLSMFIAIPMLDEGSWLVYTICDINEIAPGAAPGGLAELTMVLGIASFQIQTLWGTTQWRAHKLRLPAQLGPLTLMTAYTPAHTLPRTLTYRTIIAPDGLAAVLSEPEIHPFCPPATHVIDADDVSQLKWLQNEIEQQVRWQIVGPPQRRGAYTLLPLRREAPTNHTK